MSSGEFAPNIPETDPDDGRPFIELLAEVAAIDLNDGIPVPGARLTNQDLADYQRRIEEIRRARISPRYFTDVDPLIKS